MALEFKKIPSGCVCCTSMKACRHLKTIFRNGVGRSGEEDSGNKPEKIK